MPKPIPLIDPQVVRTHTVLFDLWFPLADFPIPPDVKAQVAPIADRVRPEMLKNFGGSESFMGLLAAMTSTVNIDLAFSPLDATTRLGSLPGKRRA